MGKQQAYNYKSLLEKDTKFARWYNNIQRGSPQNADVSLRRIGYVCRNFGYTTQRLAKMKPEQAFDVIDDVVGKLQKEGKQYEYIRGYVKVLKSWFSFNGITINQRIKVPEADVQSKVQQEQAPTPEQVKRLLNAADHKQKVEAALVGFAGLRLESVGNFESNDGLKVRDMPDLIVKDETVEFTKFPALIVVRKSLSKTGHQYITFMPEEGCQYIKELLEYRMNNGEKLTGESPIIVSLRYHQGWLDGKYDNKDKLYIDKSGHIGTSNISQSMRTAIRKAGFDWRPYILRIYFDTRMMMAEADGLIIRDWRVFWMGHKGDMEHRYTLNKGRLTDDLIEKMREAFGKAADKYLVTVAKRDASLDAVKAQFNRQFLLIAGFSEQDADNLGDLSQLTPEDISRLVQEKQKRALGLNGNSQKVVPMIEVKEYIAAGWEYVRDLQQDAIIRLPSN